MPKIDKEIYTIEEHKKEIARIKGKGFEAHESYNIVKPKIKIPKKK
jgi:hypothetical protein